MNEFDKQISRLGEFRDMLTTVKIAVEKTASYGFDESAPENAEQVIEGVAGIIDLITNEMFTVEEKLTSLYSAKL
jgi:hypothetical protein